MITSHAKFDEVPSDDDPLMKIGFLHASSPLRLSISNSRMRDSFQCRDWIRVNATRALDCERSNEGIQAFGIEPEYEELTLKYRSSRLGKLEILSLTIPNTSCIERHNQIERHPRAAPWSGLGTEISPVSNWTAVQKWRLSSADLIMRDSTRRKLINHMTRLQWMGLRRIISSAHHVHNNRH